MLGSYKKILGWVRSTFGIALFYILGVLLIGETHPFSRFPMYSSFPNWSYSFYLTDETNTVIPFSTLETFGSSVGHLYGSVSDELQIPYGDFRESREDLQKIGERMLFVLVESKDLKFRTICLYRKGFYYQNDSIHNQTELMTAYEIQ